MLLPLRWRAFFDVASSMPNATSLVLTVLGCGGTTKWLGVGGQGHTKKRDCTGVGSAKSTMRIIVSYILAHISGKNILD